MSARAATKNGAKEETPPVDEQAQQLVELAEEYVIPGGLAQAVLNYLAQRPYVEVFQLVQGLSSLQPTAKPNRATRRRAASRS